MSPCRHLLPSLLFAAVTTAGLVPGAAHAHDTWFERLKSPRAGELRLALGTGNQFPLLEGSTGEPEFAQRACRVGRSTGQDTGQNTGQSTDTPVPMRVLRDTERALQLAVRVPPRAAVTCWAQLPPYDIEIDDDKVAVYFAEIRPPAAQLADWQAMRARGVRWKERYVKNARVEVFAADGSAPALQPVPLGLDIVLELDGRAPRVGDTLAFRVLRDGAALADFPVQMVSARNAFGLWTKTDAEGRARIRLPLSGAWLLRGTELQRSTTVADAWDSRFVTLAFDVQPPPAP